MAEWDAETKSGTKYEFRGGHVRITPANGGYPTSFTQWGKMQQHPTNSNIKYPWSADKGLWHDIDVPVVGEHLFVQGKDEWRISTEIVKVTILDVGTTHNEQRSSG